VPSNAFAVHGPGRLIAGVMTPQKIQHPGQQRQTAVLLLVMGDRETLQLKPPPSRLVAFTQPFHCGMVQIHNVSISLVAVSLADKSPLTNF
jgi:hypothetical protein